MKYLWIFLLLAGCTSYSETRTSSFPFHAEGNSTINVYIEGVDVATSRQTGQEATSEADLKAALSQAAATAVATGREAILDDILNKFKAEANQTDSNNDNSVAPAPTEPAAEKPDAEKPDAETPTDSETPTDAETPTDSETPADMYGYSDFMTLFSTGATMSYNSVLQDKFVFEGKFGPDFGATMMIAWSDGNTLKVPDTSSMAMQGESGGFRKFQPGGTYSYQPANPDIPYMEVYAARDTHPKSVTIFFNEVKK